MIKTRPREETLYLHREKVWGKVLSSFWEIFYLDFTSVRSDELFWRKFIWSSITLFHSVTFLPMVPRDGSVGLQQGTVTRRESLLSQGIHTAVGLVSEFFFKWWHNDLGKPSQKKSNLSADIVRMGGTPPPLWLYGHQRCTFFLNTKDCKVMWRRRRRRRSSTVHFGKEQLMWPVLKGPEGQTSLGVCWVNRQAKFEQVSSNFGCDYFTHQTLS